MVKDADSRKSLSKEWFEFKDIVEAARLESERIEDDHANLSQPERSYQAAEALEHGRLKAEAMMKANSMSEKETDAMRSTLACMEAKTALILIHTPKAETAEATIARCTQVLAENPFQNILLLQTGYMERGKYWRGRNTQKAIDLLQQGEELYKAWKHACPKAAPYGDLSSVSLDEVSSPVWLPAQAFEQAKYQYAHTLFHLAQIFADRADAKMGAYYCGETLALQLEMDVQNHLEWAENCENMALYHLDRPDFATSQHLLNCAELRIRQAKDAPAEEVKERLASLNITWSKWFYRQLSESINERRAPGSYHPPCQELPDTLRYEQLNPPKSRTLLWDGGLAQTIEDAKEIFNASIRRLRSVLEYYTFARHPIMHCNMILEISENYRLLAEFEEDTHKRCVLHKMRAKRVEPVLHYARTANRSDLTKAVCLDLGNAYREITEIKFEEGRPFEKVAAAAREAIPYYEDFLSFFKFQGKLPDSLANKEESKQYIHTVFYLARVTSRLDPPVTTGLAGPTENLRKAVDLYRYCARFITANQIAEEKLLADRCLEMASLIQENSEMVRVSKARQMRQGQ